jgi:hypothetical protein
MNKEKAMLALLMRSGESPRKIFVIFLLARWLSSARDQ